MAKRLLIVDDSTTIHKIFKIALSKFDVVVDEAATYADGLRKVSQSRPDMLVMDANLTGVTGVDDYKRVRQAASNAACLLLVGSHEQFDPEPFVNAGFKNFLKKPFETQDIFTAIRSLAGEILLPKVATPAQARPPLPPEPTTLPETEMPLPPPPPMRGPPVETRNTHRQHADLPPPPVMPWDVPANSKRAPLAHPQPFEIEQSFESAESPSGPNPEGLFVSPPAAVFTPQLSDEQLETLKSSLLKDGLDFITEELEKFLHDEAPIIVRRTVESYCEKHFAKLSREVITNELRRLADEKARLLADS